MFRSATFRLTMWYVALLMAISIVFSGIIYNLSIREIAAGFRNYNSGLRTFPRFREALPPELFTVQQQQFDAARTRLETRLINLNLVILVVSGGVCYLLARRTLHPIENALEAQSRFTADASHELRTPLTAMKTEIEVSLRDPKLSLKETRALLASNLEEISKLESLSNGLLKLAQNNGQSPKSRVNLAKVSRQALERVEKTRAAKALSIEDKIGPLKVRGDEASLVELLVILLDNAIKYSPPDTVITLSAEQQGHTIVLSVADQGAGIKASDLPYIFDRFYRADTARSKQVDGYGLGLSIAEQIVNSHGGHIGVKSAPGRGSVFSVKLPVAPAA